MELSKPPNAGTIGNSSSLTKPASRTATSIPLFNFQTEEAQSSLWAAWEGVAPWPVSLRGWYFSEAESVIGKDKSQLFFDKIRARPQKETLLSHEEVKPAIKNEKNNKHFHCYICVPWPQTGWQYESTGTPAMPAQLPSLLHYSLEKGTGRVHVPQSYC